MTSRDILSEMYIIIKGLDDGVHLTENMSLKAKAEELRAHYQRHVSQTEASDKICLPAEAPYLTPFHQVAQSSTSTAAQSTCTIVSVDSRQQPSIAR